MWLFINTLAAPKNCYHWATRLQPWIASAGLLLFALGLISGLILAPADYQQGDAYRILFIHVPAAVLSLGVYVFMSVAVMIFLIWKIKIADMVAKVSAPLGAIFTLITLVTGALWGKPTWGTFWIWDARLTSELILLFIYLGIMALRSAIPVETLSARATSLLVMVGLVNIPIVHYSVTWWHTLHQGPTVLQFSRPTIASSMLYPLLLMFVAYILLFIWLMLLNLRAEILAREQGARWRVLL